tara:strand:+ start:412 stop:1257 length:846 start_codon:yes stop_codon:yes gene_type:complete
MSVGIIGLGYVGTALKEGFKDAHHIETYDLRKDLSTCESIDDLLKKTDLIFICVPTPMNEDGSSNLNIVFKVISQISSSKFLKNQILIIKSTIPPGTTEHLNQKYKNLEIVFNPEFLTEANFIEDFKNQDRIILGGPRPATTILKQFYISIFPNAAIIKTGSTHAEMVKYLANTFLATKVSFANEIKMICDKLDIDYDKVVEYASYDKRLGKSHWSVPGPDGNLGFGGSCFPKDINALINKASELNLDTKVINAAWETNLKVRPERDWELLEGRAVTKKDD